MSFDAQSIYKLLPSVYRIRDVEKGRVLEDFIDIIAQQAVVIQENIDELYDNWFIETSREWAVPYIGDLLGVRKLNPIGDAAGVSHRAYVANTIAYRRRKGIAPVLEQLARDVTGWSAHVVEFFELLQASQYMNHVRLHRPLTPDLRRMDELDRINSAFDSLAHSVDVRNIASAGGKYNIPNVGLFVWRLQNYPLTRCDAVVVDCVPGPLLSPPAAPIVFTFNPAGSNTQLFNRPVTETSITHISREINVPGQLRRRVLFDELNSLRAAFANGTMRLYNFFDDRSDNKDEYIFEIIRLDDQNNEEYILPEEILICNLEHCCTPPDNLQFEELKEDGTIITREIKALVDPVCGRFMFADQDPAARALVSYSYGFSGDIGGGPYNRQSTIPSDFLDRNNAGIWQVGVSQTFDAVQGEQIYGSVSEALAEWNTKEEGTIGIIAVMDSRTYVEDLEIIIHKESRLLIIAADWPVRNDANDGSEIRYAGDLMAQDVRPFISGDITVTGHGNEDRQDTAGELIINGIMAGGKISILDGQLGKFSLVHSTILPTHGGLDVGSGVADLQSNQWLTVRIDRSISGTINMNDTAAVKILVSGSILDLNQRESSDHSLRSGNTPVELNCVTLFGKTEVKTIEASNCIFNDRVVAKRRQEGCIRFSFVPKNSKPPRLYRCQPDLEIHDRIEEETTKKGSSLSDSATAKIRNDVEERMVPSFTSVEQNHFGYAQLSMRCPAEISAGADNGSEMGAFNYLMQPQREANLKIALEEYLPFGLRAGIFHVN